MFKNLLQNIYALMCEITMQAYPNNADSKLLKSLLPDLYLGQKRGSK